MGTLPYRDLLWDFSFSDFGPSNERRNEVRLRVFASEAKLFFRTPDPAAGFLVTLPLDWLGGAQEGRRSYAQSSPSSDFLLVVGRQLWDALPEEARKPLLDAAPERPCRLKISSVSPAIYDLPWEWLNDGTQPFAMRTGVRLVRSVPIRVPVPPLTVMPSIQVLLVITNPRDERLLNPFQEIQAVQPRLMQPPYELRVLEEPTLKALVAALREGRGPHIVHYIGHAGLDRGGGNLILHDSYDRTHWISAQELADVLPVSVRLLCLSTCFTAPNYQIAGLSRLAHTPATYSLPTAIANRYPVTEGGVRAFWEAFYHVLAATGGDTGEAFREAQMHCYMAISTGDWGSFSLVIRDQTGQGFRIEPGEHKLASEPDALTEIQAQFSAGVANQLAQAMESFEGTPPDALSRLFEEESARAARLSGTDKEES